MKSYPEMIADTKADIAKLDKRIAELKKQKGNSKNMPLSERIDKLEDARACTYYNLRGMEEYLAAHPEEVTIMNETEQSGKESDMGKNNATFLWSPGRRAKLENLHQEGASVYAIARYFGVDAAKVEFAMKKYSIHQKPKKPVVNEEFENVFNPDPPPAVLPPSPPSAQTIDTKHLNELLHYIVDAANHNNDIMAFLTEAKEDHAFFDLGQQAVKLHEAEKIIKTLLKQEDVQ